MISHLRGEVSTSYFKPSTPLGSTITQRKLLDPPVLTTCTSTNDNEALYKVSLNIFKRFYVPLKNFSLIWRRHHCRWRAAKFRPKLDAQGLWAGRDLYRVTPAVTRGLGLSSLIRRTAPFSRLLRHTRGCGGSILTRILQSFKSLRSAVSSEKWAQDFVTDRLTDWQTDGQMDWQKVQKNMSPPGWGET
jgi:hypothetical protein